MARRKRKILKGEYVSFKCHKPVNFRSGLELQFIIQLEKDPTVKRFDYECFNIPYKRKPTNIKTSKYIPDFVVWYTDGTIVVIEIKPNSQLKNKTVKIKAEFAEKWCQEKGYLYRIETDKTIKITRIEAILLFENQCKKTVRAKANKMKVLF